MTGLLHAFSHLITGKVWNDLPASFCYTIGNKINLPYPSVFTLFEGTKDTSNERVSIFIYAKKTTERTDTSNTDGGGYTQFARNCLKCIRTIRHPYILRILEAIEVPSGIYIVTEPIKPLCLTELPSDPTWGLFQISTAVDFLNEGCHTIHGLVCPYSVFVTEEDAHWRLGTFDAVFPVHSPYSLGSHPLHTVGVRTSSGTNSSPRIDRWGLASITAWVYASLKLTSNSCDVISLKPEENMRYLPPKALHLCQNLLLSSNETTPLTSLKPILETDPFFSENELLKVMLFFEQINLKGNWEKESFFMELPEVMNNIQSQIQYLQILPQLTQQLDFYTQPALLVPSILFVGETISRDKKQEVNGENVLYRQRIVPVLLKLFKCPDRLIRYTLLQNLTSLDPHLTTKDVQEIFDSICLGFTDSFPSLREATLRSMIYFVPKLKLQVNIDKALQKICRTLQEDTEGAIRTNAVICLAKLVSSFSSSQHIKIVCANLIKATKDPFPACKIAALKSAAVCSAQDEISPEDMMTRIAPAVCQRCCDTDFSVRSAAFNSIEQLVLHARTRLDKAIPTPSVPSQNGISTTSSLLHDTVKPHPNENGIENPLKHSNSGWTGRVFKKALIDFYGVKQPGSKDLIPPSGSLQMNPTETTPRSSHPKLETSNLNSVLNKKDTVITDPAILNLPDELDRFFDVNEAPNSASDWDNNTELFDETDDRSSNTPESISHSKLKDTTVFDKHLIEKNNLHSSSTLNFDALSHAITKCKFERPSFQSTGKSLDSNHTSVEKTVASLTDEFWTSFEPETYNANSNTGDKGVQSLQQILQARKAKQHTNNKSSSNSLETL